mgnify:CR=1 FL=1
MTVDGDTINFEKVTARLVESRGTEVLNCGTQRTTDGEKTTAKIPVGEHKNDIEELREDSKDNTPLTYTVEEYTKTTSAGGWGKRELTKQRLVPSKSRIEMTDRESSLHIKINTDRVPNNTDPGDVLTLDDLLDDPRTREQKDNDALDTAAETGEEVIISENTTRCNDPSKECNIDYVTRVAKPNGEIETHRAHTY